MRPGRSSRWLIRGDEVLVSEALRDAARLFRDAKIETPVLDAEVILAHVLKVERYMLISDGGMELPGASYGRFVKLVNRRLQREPVAYLTGRKEFYSLEFLVTRDVLIPRPETELIVDLALYYAIRNSRVLDLGTGSGAIAVALNHSRDDLAVCASDISIPALKIAKKNTKRILGAGKIKFFAGDLFEPFPGQKFDMILSNPPYIARDAMKTLQPELSREPETALLAGKNGRAVIEKIVALSRGHLTLEGKLILEIGSEMKEYAVDHGSRHGFDVSVFNDHAGMPRVAVFTLKKGESVEH